MPCRWPNASIICSTSRILSFVLSRELTLGIWMMAFSWGSRRRGQNWLMRNSVVDSTLPFGGEVEP